MTTTATGPRDLANLRDVAGLPTDDGGRTAPGVLWRSDAPLDGDVTATGPGGVAWPPPSVVDLRNGSELPAPHPLAARGAALTSLPLIEALAPARRERSSGRVTVDELYLLLLDFAETWLPDLFTVAAHGPGPMLVHCAAGKDRTGVAVAVLLRAAGIPRGAVTADFAATNDHHRALRDRLVAQGVLDPQVTADEVGVVPAHIGPVLDRLEPDPWTVPLRAGVAESDLVAWRSRLVPGPA